VAAETKTPRPASSFHIRALYNRRSRSISNLYAHSDNSCRRAGSRPLRRNAVLDTFLIAGGVGFFALAVFYLVACDRM
jgi:hypothetical protein